MFRFILVLILVALTGNFAGATTLFSENFQDGTTGDWKGNPSKGDIRLSSYKENISLRLQHDAYAIYLVPTRNHSQINVSASFAASKLRSGDYCVLETSFGGNTWAEIGRVGDGDDDGFTLHNIVGATPEANGHKLLAIRVRIHARKDSSTCWVDNVKVIGTTDGKSLAQSIPFSTFFSGKKLVKPFGTAAYIPRENAGTAHQSISGSLFLAAPKLADGFSILKDDFNYESVTGKLNTLPSFSLEVISDGNALIPIQRGPQQNTHPDWEWIFEPGRIWSEENDEGWSRAALPIAFQERNANCVHNGLMSFLYKDGKISQAIVQIGSETCAYMQFDMWSRLTLGFESTEIETGPETVQAYRQEVRSRLRRLPIGALNHVDISQIGSPQEVAPENMTTYGYVMDKALYAGECRTRHGDYPYCETMPLPSYSMAKSMVAGIGLMRLEKLYPGARHAKIANYVPQCAAKKWGDVSFEQALDMTTGNYTSDEYDKDESSSKTWKFMTEETHAAKIASACSVHKRKTKPGKKFVYHTTDTYILGTAMQAYLREKSANTSADIYADLIQPIWRELGLSPLAMTTRRTRDLIAQPFTGWGLTLYADDIARIGLFLQNDGKILDETWLDGDILNAALQKKSNDHGHKAINDSLRYRSGFWAYNAGPFIGCKNDMWIPNMSGFGGLATVLLPNGHIYFYISDGHEYAWRRAAKASNEIKPFCENNHDN